ncbi:MAG: hypothetical protein PHN18_10360 [Sulfurospirillaceae bacterium]|nr:hypothetical protein [Sulfurospirillaceae bacterium]MDD2827458.1 hypothetical protein [Sulfurospirillaceae bacterium]
MQNLPNKYLFLLWKIIYKYKFFYLKVIDYDKLISFDIFNKEVKQNLKIDTENEQKYFFDLYVKHNFTLYQYPIKSWKDLKIEIAYSKNSNECLLTHTTSLKTMFSIIGHKSIYGTDANGSAHFHWFNRFNNSPNEDGVRIYFKYNGEQKELGMCEISHHEDKLCHIAVCDYLGDWELMNGSYWESRLYPSMKGSLEILAVSLDQMNRSIIFNEPFHIQVIRRPRQDLSYP